MKKQVMGVKKVDYKMKTKVIKSEKHCNSFAERDLFYIVSDKLKIDKDILCIDYFEIPKKNQNKGHGTKILKQFCEENKEKFILFLVAGLPIKEDELEMELTHDGLHEKLSRLEKFYTSVGFVNINAYIGQYENKISFLYKDGLGCEIVSGIVN